mmetsp:Transcript_32340/g.87659  ORF Transcript_32340/g.87659 Transcript_32340/m.87659 type:complete len:232 (-) Transcript_32340:409-1104(-)
MLWSKAARAATRGPKLTTSPEACTIPLMWRFHRRSTMALSRRRCWTSSWVCPRPLLCFHQRSARRAFSPSRCGAHSWVGGTPRHRPQVPLLQPGRAVGRAHRMPCSSGTGHCQHRGRSKAAELVSLSHRHDLRRGRAVMVFQRPRRVWRISTSKSSCHGSLTTTCATSTTLGKPGMKRSWRRCCRVWRTRRPPDPVRQTRGCPERSLHGDAAAGTRHPRRTSSRSCCRPWS